MTDQSGVFPEKWPDDSMLEAAWGLIANANEGDWDKALPEWREAAVCWRAAYHRTLERPRPAPPDTLESVTVWLDSFDWWDENTKGMARAILKRYGGGSAGTGAAPPDLLIQAAEEAANVLAALATRVKWGGISNVSRSEEDHWRKLAGDIRGLVRGGAAQPPPSALEMRNDNLRSELEGVYRDYDFLRAEFDEYKRTHPGVPREETNHE